MHIMWRGLELPGRVVLDNQTSDDSYGRFTIEPFEQGFGTTIGNSLRRVLLSSLEGAAVTAVKIEGVSHEFASMDGVVEDVTDILLNVKGIVIKYEKDEPTTMHLVRDEAGEVRAGDLKCEPSVEIVNPGHLIATLTANVPFHMELRVGRGRGYVTAADNRTSEQELGVIPVDSIFAPVLRVRYTTEAMRVGKRTNYDRLILEIWTNGSVTPEDALVESALILRKHLNPFVMYHELGDQTVSQAKVAPTQVVSGADSHLDELLQKPISTLNLSVRASNCLESGKISTLRQLVALTEADLLRFRSFGKTSLQEVHRKLDEVGLTLGMKFDDGAEEAGEVGQFESGEPDDPLSSSARLPRRMGISDPQRLPPQGLPRGDGGPSGATQTDAHAHGEPGPASVYTMDD